VIINSGIQRTSSNPAFDSRNLFDLVCKIENPPRRIASFYHVLSRAAQNCGDMGLRTIETYTALLFPMEEIFVLEPLSQPLHDFSREFLFTNSFGVDIESSLVVQGTITLNRDLVVGTGSQAPATFQC